jgi:hypothetical protein
VPYQHCAFLGESNNEANFCSTARLDDPEAVSTLTSAFEHHHKIEDWQIIAIPDLTSMSLCDRPAVSPTFLGRTADM